MANYDTRYVEMYANLVCVLFGARWTHGVQLLGKSQMLG